MTDGRPAEPMKRPAIESPDEGGLDYLALESRVRRAADWLCSRGVAAGDIVAIAMPRQLALVEIVLGALRISAVALPLNDRYTARELRHPLTHAPAKLAILPDFAMEALCDIGIERIAASDVRAALDAAPLPPSNGAPYDLAAELRRVASANALLLYTSGTTGQPKGAMLTADNVRATIEALQSAWEITDRDVFLHVLPQYHVHGLVVATFGALSAGATSIWFGAPGRFEPMSVLAELASGRASVFMAVPTLWHRLLEQPGRFDLSGLRLATSGSAGLPAETHRRVRERFSVEIVERYGMTEAGIVASNPLRGERRAGSIGVPLPGVEIAILCEDGRACPDGEVGELAIRAPSVFSGYHRDPAATAEALREGWLRSGDLGTRAPDGYLTLVGRRSELVIVGGFNVYPAEVEAVLLSCAGVREAAVVGIADEDLGEIPVAAYVGEASPEDLLALLRTQLAPYKIPRALRRVDTLPRNAMGKIVRSLLWSQPEETGRE